MYVLAIDTGMRQGELLALQWSDVDFDARTVVVQRTLENLRGQVRVNEPKTSRSRRKIDLSRYALDALSDHRKAMLAEGHAKAPVFCAPNGGWMQKSNLRSRSFLPTVARANAKDAEEAAQQGREP